MFFWEFMTLRFSPMPVIFWFYTGCNDSPYAHLHPLYLNASSLLLYFILLAFFISSLSPFLSQAPCENLRTPSTYPGNMLPHHPGQGNFEDFTCWADTHMKHQSACYATKANHTTRTIRHRECEELIRSLTEALFTYKRSKADKSNTTKNCHPRPSGEDIPKNKKISVNFPENISCSTLLSLCFPLEYCRKGCSWRNLANTDLSFKRQKVKCKNKQGNMYSYLTIDSRS